VTLPEPAYHQSHIEYFHSHYNAIQSNPALTTCRLDRVKSTTILDVCIAISHSRKIVHQSLYACR
jgi:hypothetical protein